MRLIDSHALIKDIHKEMKSNVVTQDYYKGINYILYRINISPAIDLDPAFLCDMLGDIKCPNCGNHVVKTYNYCPCCGTKMQKESVKKIIMTINYGKKFEERFKIDWIKSFPHSTIVRLYDNVSGYLSISNI